MIKVTKLQTKGIAKVPFHMTTAPAVFRASAPASAILSDGPCNNGNWMRQP